MRASDAIRENIEYRQRWANTYGEEYYRLDAFVVPPWLEELDVSPIVWFSTPTSKPSFIISGDISVVKAIQQATGCILQRVVSEATGDVSFKGAANGIGIEVCGSLPLAPTCRLVPYTVEVTKFRVECDDNKEVGKA